MKLTDIEARSNEAMKYLTDTDEVCADLKHLSDNAEARWNLVVDARMLMSDQKSADLRKADARTHKDSIAAFRDWMDARLEFDKVMNKRRSEALAVEWCRSLYSNYRQGK